MERFGPGNQAISKIRILDLGCGTGDQIVYMSRLGFQMSGCDISKDFIASTRTALETAGAASIDVRLSRAPTELPFESDQFHAVYANGVFEHCTQMPSLIAEISRVLLPEGVFLAAFPLRSIIIEPHLKLPFVHWFAKGRPQRLLISIMSHIFHPERNCQSIERYLQNEVFYWTSSQVRQILHKHFEETSRPTKQYLMIAKNQMNRNAVLRSALAATAVPVVSSFVEHLLASQWTYIVEANNPIKR